VCRAVENTANKSVLRIGDVDGSDTEMSCGLFKVEVTRGRAQSEGKWGGP